MTKENHSSSEADFYLQVEDFVLSASIDAIRNHPLENEIRLFLLTLLNHHKQQETN